MFFKRNIKQSTPEIQPIMMAPTPINTELKRVVQLCLHANQVFPSAINITEDNWAEVTFYPSNRWSNAAGHALRELQNQGRIVLEGALQPTPFDPWTAKLRVCPQ